MKAPIGRRRLLTRILRRPPRGPRRRSVLVIALIVIAAWQWDFFRRAPSLDRNYVHRQASGMNDEHRFIYFLYYLGLYPVIANDGHSRMRDEPGYRKFHLEAARRVVQERGDTLAMETRQTIRAGEMGRGLLYLPYAIWTGSARNPRLAPTHAVVFTFALGALFTALWWARDPVLGGVSVVLLGSNPYQLAEVHATENIFGWTITTGILALALSVPLLRKTGAGRWAWLPPLLLGALLGTVRQIRPEPVAILAAAAAACVTLARASWLRRIALGAVLLVTFSLTSRLWLSYFDHKFDEARQVVAAAGGRVYEGPRDRYHMFWHPFWCGLGDFGQDRGYQWWDRAAYRYATPLVRARYEALGHEPDWRFIVWDPVYNEVLAAKVRHDITHHPFWYAGILIRRIWRVLTWTTPVRFAAGPWSVTVPWNGLAVLPVLGLLAWTRSWATLKLTLFPLGSSLSAILIFSGTIPGQTYSGWFHVMGAAVVVAALIETLAVITARRRAAPPGGGRPSVRSSARRPSVPAS
jgi:hypothetical protein